MPVTRAGKIFSWIILMMSALLSVVCGFLIIAAGVIINNIWHSLIEYNFVVFPTIQVINLALLPIPFLMLSYYPFRDRMRTNHAYTLVPLSCTLAGALFAIFAFNQEPIIFGMVVLLTVAAGVVAIVLIGNLITLKRALESPVHRQSNRNPYLYGLVTGLLFVTALVPLGVAAAGVQMNFFDRASSASGAPDIVAVRSARGVITLMVDRDAGQSLGDLVYDQPFSIDVNGIGISNMSEIRRNRLHLAIDPEEGLAQADGSSARISGDYLAEHREPVLLVIRSGVNEKDRFIVYSGYL